MDGKGEGREVKKGKREERREEEREGQSMWGKQERMKEKRRKTCS